MNATTAPKKSPAKAALPRVSHAKTRPGDELPNISIVKLVPLDLIDILPQLRSVFDEESLQELAADIQARGLLQPVLLNPCGGRFALIAGGRRVRACRIAGLSDVPALITKASESAALLMQLAENIQRENLELDDLVKAVRLLHDSLGTVKAVAQEVKKSSAWVSKRLALSHLEYSWCARSLLEDGITEDIEILNIVNQLTNLNTGRAQILARELRAGNATRETARQALKDAKNPVKNNDEAQAAYLAQQQAAAETSNPPDNALRREQIEDTGEEFIEYALRNLHGNCAEPDGTDQNATTYLNSLREDQRDALLAHLRRYHAEAKTWTSEQWAQALMPYNSDANYLELFVAVMAIKGQAIDNLYALVAILEQANQEPTT